MSYHIYTTNGIILKRTPFGEANLLLHVLTEDLGLIQAGARSARVSASKLRPALQEFEEVSLSCIKGKSGWKITNVVGKGNFFFEYPKEFHKVLAQIGAVLLQMIQGESPHKEIFHITKSGFDFLKRLNAQQISSFEILTVFRILYELGYIAKDTETEVFIVNNSLWSTELLSSVDQNKKMLVERINKALKESHL
jgi:DNA repair protein RecO